jgi:Zn-dependent protease with chaperone function
VIETAADFYALEVGGTRRQLASALLKFDPLSPGTNFSGHADARVAALLSNQRLESSTARLEWIPLLLVLALAAGCRLAGIAMPV